MNRCRTQTRTRRRTLAVVAATAGLAASAFTGTASAAPIPTEVKTQAAVLELGGSTGISLAPQGRLVRKDTGAGLANKRIEIILGSSPGTMLCSGLTSSSGSFRCGGSLPNMLAVTLNLGYYARFPGDATYATSGARGPIVRVLGISLF